MSKSRFAGELYEAKEFDLDKQITACFEDKNGPGDLPLSKRESKIQAIIAPHSAYNLSGPCAAWAYKEIAESGFPDLYIILAAGHEPTENTVGMQGYETPLGLART